MREPLLRSARQIWRCALFYIHHGQTNGNNSIPHESSDNIESLLSRLHSESFGRAVLTPKDVTDYGRVGFVADPFVHIEDGVVHLFFEVFNPNRTPTAVIGHATSDDQGRSWEYDQVVLEHERHLSFPYVFEANDEVYLLPDIENADGEFSPATLFRAAEFPHRWEPVVDIIAADHKCLDTAVFRTDGRWWAIMGAGTNDELRIYYSDSLTAPAWQPHEANPVVTDRVTAGRPAGRPLVQDGRVILPLQDCRSEYGEGVRMYEITELSEHTYVDKPLFDDRALSGTGGRGWNSGRMHHLDLVWDSGDVFCSVDGDIGMGRNQLSGSMWSVGVGTSSR